MKRKSWFTIFSSGDEEEDGTKRMEEPAKGSFFNPDERIMEKEIGELVLECLGQLPDEQRAILIMKEYEGMKFREIAISLQISENTAKSRLYYGLKAMKKILEEKNYNKEILNYGY